MPRSSCIKWKYGRSGIDYRVAPLFTRYLTAKGTRMKTFIKTKFKISEDQINIDKYRLAANITVYHISK